MTAYEPAPLAGGILRVLRPDGAVAGAAFLVTDRLAVTCAHVLDTGAGTGPGSRVMVDVGAAHGPGPFPATVRDWHPGTDVAVLEVAAPLPGTRPVPLVETGDRLWGHRARTLGFPRGHHQGVWHAAVLRQQQGNGWLQFEQAADGRYPVRRGFSGAPVWDDELAAVVGMVVAADLGNPVAFLIPTDRLVAAAPSLREVVGLPSPFPGLGAYQEHDSQAFFGRDRETERITRLVLGHPLVTVLGASGCGKSSVVRAGVVPRLRAEGLATCVVPRTRDLLGALAAGLSSLIRPGLHGHAQRTEIRSTRRELAEGRLPELIDQIRATRGVDGLVIVVDQLEELLTRQEATATLGLLFGPEPPEGLRILTTLRVDFLPQVEEQPLLRRAVQGATFVLPQMTGEQIREVVTGPVGRVPAVAYQDGLVDRIVADVGNAAGVLPLLAFTLDQLWREQRAGLLTQEAYARLGGVHGALAQRAEHTWRRYTATAGGGVPEDPGGDGEEDAARQLRRLLTRLIRLPPGTRTPIRRTVRRTELPDGEWEAARALADQRLLVIAPPATEEDVRYGESVELAHEALISVWPRLRHWAEEDRDFLAWYERLRQDRLRWETAGAPDDLLPGATALEAARPWLAGRREDIDTADADFLDRGRSRLRRQRRVRNGVVTGLTTALVIAIVAGALFAYQTRVSAVRQQESDSRALAAESAAVLDSDPPLAALYALAAHERAPTGEAQDALLQTYIAYGFTEVMMSGARGGVQRLATSDDGRVILVSGREGQVTLFVRDGNGQLYRERLPFGDDYAIYPFVSPDGGRVGWVTLSGALVWHELSRPGEPGSEADPRLGEGRTIAGQKFAMDESGLSRDQRSVAVSRDGDRVVVASAYDNELHWWDLDAGVARPPVTLPEPYWSEQVWFSRTPDRVLVETVDDLLNIDLRSGELLGVVAEDITSAAVSGDGETVAVCDPDNTLHVARSGVETQTVVPETCYGGAPALDPAGRYVSDGSVTPVVYALSGDGEATRLPQTPGNALTEDFGHLKHPGLLRDGDRYFFLVATDETVALLEQSVVNEPVHGAMRLLGDGEVMLSYSDRSTDEASGGEGGSALLLYDIGASGQEYEELARVERRGATHVPELFDVVAVDREDTLMADLMTEEGHIVIRDTATLQEVTELQVTAPPDDPHPNSLPGVDMFFQDDRLITCSGTVVERWDVATGERIDRVDLADLGVLSDDPLHAGQLRVASHPSEGHISVTNGGPEVRVVELAAGREVPGRRIDTGARINVAIFHNPHNERHLMVVRPGTAWEQWEVPAPGSDDPPRRLSGPTEVCPGCTHNPAISPSVRPDGRFQLAAADRVGIYEPDSAIPVEHWDVGRGGDFLATSTSGDTLLYGPWEATSSAWSARGTVTVVRLDDTDTWRAEACRVSGWLTRTDAEEIQRVTDTPVAELCDSPPAGEGDADGGDGENGENGENERSPGAPVTPATVPREFQRGESAGV
ncbi:hypothetical protein GCM10009757_30820 [Streptomyces cheonanensis]|uniref:Novel STAND NTPase 1 domain-containing protein n=1 Tax=Streptomyces cheonanensis TaxID=312720 RepID=A0ABP5GR54_9ACTN